MSQAAGALRRRMISWRSVGEDGASNAESKPKAVEFSRFNGCLDADKFLCGKRRMPRDVPLCARVRGFVRFN